PRPSLRQNLRIPQGRVRILLRKALLQFSRVSNLFPQTRTKLLSRVWYSHNSRGTLKGCSRSIRLGTRTTGGHPTEDRCAIRISGQTGGKPGGLAAADAAS